LKKEPVEGNTEFLRVLPFLRDLRVSRLDCNNPLKYLRISVNCYEAVLHRGTLNEKIGAVAEIRRLEDLYRHGRNYGESY
jgi:hypothetical protein